MTPAARLTRLLARHLARRPVRVPRAMPPTLSFTFDDVPRSALDHALPMLTAAGHAATWYIAGSLLDTSTPTGRVLSRDDLTLLRDAGQEVASHGYAHRSALDLHGPAFDRDLAENHAFLAEETGHAPRSYSFPFGVATPGGKRAALARYGSARGIAPGIARDSVDLGLLPANALYATPGAETRLTALLDDLATGGGWAILYTHDVTDTPSPWGCTPALFARTVVQAQARGLRVVPVGHMIDTLVGTA